MTDESQTARQIFCELIELATPDAQDRFLADQITDSPVIGQRVRSLLQAHRSSEKFLGGARGNSVDADSTRDDETPFPEGFQIDRYRLVEVIGEGGFGVVYQAEQQEPVCRQVALKLIKPGMDTRQVVARFEYERQSLAMMDHPNIARVLDGGATKNGRPYFVMELVCGQPITKYCISQSMELVDRLKLFQTVCDGVQHAHQKGIIHRDLKPSNILVVAAPTGPIVKIIDFGVAKAINPIPGEQSSLTRGGTLIGTPVYMSPEQTTPGIQDIDTRSDIYSLGVILYELLAGSTPFDKKWLETLDADQFRQAIRDVDPPRPSQRTIQTANSFKNDDPQRYRETKKKGAMLRGELDWIGL